MRGSNRIYHRPYCPPNRKADLKKPFICRLAPFADGFEFEWLDSFCSGSHTLYYGLRGSEEKIALPVTDAVVRIEGLLRDTDYEFYLESAAGERSNVRLLRTAENPEGATVINYLHKDDEQYIFSGKYLCSPSIVRCESGRLIAGMDVFGGMMPQNLVLLFKSEDNGKTWRYLTDLYPFYWASLFRHRGVIYILGLTTEYGNLQISCSRDDGETWENPVTLFYGSSVLCKTGGCHRAPMMVNNIGGRLYTSTEYGCWKTSHLPAVLSIDENDDLMVPENWVRSELMPFAGEWKKAAAEPVQDWVMSFPGGWQAKDGRQLDTMEGNVLRGPDGNIYNYMRWRLGAFLQLKVNENDPEAPLEFAKIVNAPVSNSMFKVLPWKNGYLLVTNHVTENSMKFHAGINRNVLSVFYSEDMENFRFLRSVVNRDTEDPENVGFQYPATILEGDDLYVTVRASYGSAHACHDANYNLFFHLKDLTL